MFPELDGKEHTLLLTATATDSQHRPKTVDRVMRTRVETVMKEPATGRRFPSSWLATGIVEVEMKLRVMEVACRCCC